MTRDEVRAQVREAVAEQQGQGYATEFVDAKSLQEAFSVTSLDVVSLQMSMEERFGLKFANSAADRGAIDKFWDDARGVEDLVELVLKFRC